MYSERERLIHHQQLLSKESAAADLQLLKEKNPKHPRLAEFSVSPKHHAGDILFELLKVCSRDEIVRNRLAVASLPLKTPLKTSEKTSEETPESGKTQASEKKPEKKEVKKKTAKKGSPKKTNTPK